MDRGSDPVLKRGSRPADNVRVQERAKSDSGSRLGTIRRAVTVSLIALVVASGCVTQDPPGRDYVEDLQSDFETEKYFDP